MQKVVLENGLTILFERKQGRSVVVEVMIKSGSCQEHDGERGVSHFLEHILFEGTTTRPSNLEISREIENIGGDLNAYTSNERTCFYVKVLNKHFRKAIEVLADILKDPLMREKDIEREKKVVLKEIEMVLDEPRFYQWVLLQKTLFEKHPCRYPTYGDKQSVLTLSREKILRYFRQHYVPSNMIISVVGDVTNWKKEIETQFNFPRQKYTPMLLAEEPKAHKMMFRKEKKKISNTYVVIGFKTVPKKSNDAYVLELINVILGRGQSCRLFNEIRSKQGLAYDVGTQHIADAHYGYFAAYACIDKKNVEKTNQLILKEIESLKNLSSKELEEAKLAIEGEYYLDLEDGQRLADQLLFWDQAQGAEHLDKFIARIKKVSGRDIRRVIETYFKYYTFIVLEGR